MKHKLQNLLKHNWRTLLLLLTLITTSQGAWAWFTSSYDAYFDASVVASNWSLDSKHLYVKICYGNNTNNCNTYEMTKVTNSNYLYKCTSFKNQGDISHVQFFAGDNSSDYEHGMTQQSLSGWSHFIDELGNCCWDVNSTSSDWVSKHDCKTPPLTTVSLDKYNTTTYGGTGTSDDPYRVVAGTTIQVEASSTMADNSMYAWYNFKVNSEEYGSYSTTSTKQVIASAEAGTNYSAQVKGKGCDSDLSSSNISVNSRESSTVYFKTVYCPYVIKGVDGNWDDKKEFNSSGNYTYTANSNGFVEFKLQPYNNNETWYGNGQKMRLGLSNTISGTSGDNCKLYVQNGITYTFHYDGKDVSNNPIITITPSTQTAPTNIYIRGYLLNTTCVLGNYGSAFAKASTEYSQTVTARTGCSGTGQKEFILSASDDENADNENLLNGRYVFDFDGDSPGWEYSGRLGCENYFKTTLSYSDNAQLKITVTWNNTTKRFKMKVEPPCEAPSSVVAAVDKSCLTYRSGVQANLSFSSITGGTEDVVYKWTIPTNPGSGANFGGASTSSSETPTATFTAAGTYVFRGVVACSADATSPYSDVTVVVNPAITAYTLSSSAGASSVCPNAEVTITLANTQSGYTYELYKDGVAVPNSQQARSATGSITWTEHPFVESEYSVKAWKTSCDDYVAEMSNSVTVSVKGDLALSAEPIEVTPYQPVALTVTGTSIGDLVWTTSSSDAAIYGSSTKLVTTNENPAIFKAPEGTYTVTITATDDGCPNVSKTVSITVNADSEDC